MSEQTDKMLVRYTQAETAYVPLSMTPGAACANCRWFMNTSDVGQGCHIIENYPADVLPTGWCNHHEALPSLEPEPLAVELVGIGERAHEEHEEPETGYIAPDSNEIGILKSIRTQFTRGMKPGHGVLKAQDGKRLMLVITSNSYRDRVKDTITTEALQKEVDRHWKADDLYMSGNPLLYWHHDKAVMGDIVFGDVRGPFLVELAKEREDLLSKALFDYAETHPEEDWGASHRFAFYRSERQKDGTIHRIFKKETTFLPRADAANLLTFSGVLPMADKRATYFDKMLGFEGAMETLETKGINALVEQLASRGIQHKSADEIEEPSDAFKAFGKLAVQLVQDVADMSEQLDAAKKDYTDKSAALDTERQAMTDAFKTIQTELDTLKAQLDARPRSASRATETQVEGAASEDAQKTLDALQYENHPLFGRVKKQPDQL